MLREDDVALWSFLIGATSPPNSLTRMVSGARNCVPPGEHAEQNHAYLTVLPTSSSKEVEMDVIYPRCAGLDVHEAFVMVCRRVLGANGEVEKAVRRYSTMTVDLLAMADWLTTEGVTHVAMESTGVFWKPVWNLLEGRFTILLVNPRDVKQVPGRKTDVSDAGWIAQLLQHGLLKSSFVPPAPIRILRDLTRHRTTLVRDKTRAINRIHKILEDANVKLTAVASDIMGASGRAMLEALVRGETNPQVLADVAQRRLRSKLPQLEPALTGRVQPHHRALLASLLAQVTFLETQVAEMERAIDEAARPFAPAHEALGQAS
jgi:transposase